LSVNKRISDEGEVNTYLARLHYALGNRTTKINFQETRESDVGRNIRFTNQYTIAHLFPNEDVVEVLKREIKELQSKDYLHTVKDTLFPLREEMYVFARKYDDYVYIKIRVCLLSEIGTHIFVLSFHYSEISLKQIDFPYSK